MKQSECFYLRMLLHNYVFWEYRQFSAGLFSADNFALIIQLKTIKHTDNSALDKSAHSQIKAVTEIQLNK